jgi:hypothetical protein
MKSEWYLDGILLVPPAYFRGFQKLQNSLSQPLVLKQGNNFQPWASSPPLPLQPFDLFLEGQQFPLPRPASAKQMSAGLFPSGATPPAGVRLCLFNPREVCPNEGMAGRQLKENRRLTLGDVLKCLSYAPFLFGFVRSACR